MAPQPSNLCRTVVDDRGVATGPPAHAKLAGVNRHAEARGQFPVAIRQHCNVGRNPLALKKQREVGWFDDQPRRLCVGGRHTAEAITHGFDKLAAYLSPGVHYKRIRDRQAGNFINALGLDLGVVHATLRDKESESG